MAKRNISRGLQMQIRRYLEYMHEEEVQGSKRGNYILKKLSKNLQNNLKTEAYIKFLSNVSLFKSNFSENFLMKLCSKIEEIIIAPDEIISHVLNYNMLMN